MNFQHKTAIKKEPDNKRPLIYVLLKKYGLRGALEIVKQDVGFDIKHRTNTALPVSQRQLFASALHDAQNRYVPTTFSVFKGAMAYADTRVDLSECGFVDLGSGKAKALIAATAYDLVSIRGVEVSPRLHAIASKNIERLGLEGKVELKQHCVTQLKLKKHERILYFFNSFRGPVLDACLQNIVAAPRAGEGVLIYVNPTEHEHVERYFEPEYAEFLDPGHCEVNYYSLPANRREDNDV